MVFLTGATGYMGRRLAAQLVRRGRPVTALVRQGSETKAPPGCTVAIGDALNASSYRERVSKGCTFVHLVGVAHPSPAKAAEFQAIDLVSIRAAVEAARFADVRHFIYVSVAHPAPVMEAYIAVRTEGESLIQSAGFNATILRPWYVLGPGHRWPAMLLPVYWIMERIPGTRESARRLGLVTLRQMIGALADAVDRPCDGVRVMEVPEIRRYFISPSFSGMSAST
jgi:uncharacterized protein YbjT (DUF2867 family)